MRPEPRELRPDEVHVHAVAADRLGDPGAEAGLERGAPRAAARTSSQRMAGGEGSSSSVDEDGGGGLADDGDACDGAEVRSGGEALAHLGDGSPPALGVDLRPSGRGHVAGAGDRGFGERAAIFRDDETADPRSA